MRPPYSRYRRLTMQAWAERVYQAVIHERHTRWNARRYVKDPRQW